MQIEDMARLGQIIGQLPSSPRLSGSWRFHTSWRYGDELGSTTMITYDGQATIERSVEEVFAYASVPENLLNWSDVSYVERLSDGPMGLGSRIKITMGKPPLRATSDYEISEWDENRRWTYKTIPPNWILWDATYVLEPLGPSSTRISTSGQIALKGIRRALEPIIRNEISKGEQGELDRLKAILEQ